MPAEKFATIYQRAAERKGGERPLESLLYPPLATSDLAALGDDRYLAECTKKIFQSGFVWRVVEQKWADFESLFFQFDIEEVLLMPDEMLEEKGYSHYEVSNYSLPGHISKHNSSYWGNKKYCKDTSFEREYTNVDLFRLKNDGWQPPTL